ncbi:MAG: DNA gyrase inhibitor YacG [Thauera sp.]|jgi:endogenous inhibitor of DNA gyrase (YacG/DUF329 family)|nr:DNA gyrase inhibitor YacG [Thauera sp.]
MSKTVRPEQAPTRTVSCPNCGKAVLWSAAASPFRPFCSARCRQIDLGEWASESYRVPSSPPDGELEN